MEKQEINKLLDERDAIYNKNPKSKKVDSIQDQIMEVIKKDFKKFEVDFIVETITRFGAAPQIIYDDNGLFAVISTEGFPVFNRKGNKRQVHVVKEEVSKKQFKSTIREALKHYLFKEVHPLNKK